MLKLKSNPKAGQEPTHGNADMNLQVELDNLYGRLKGIRQLRGAMTSQSRKDFNRIVEMLGCLGVLARADVFSLRVNELGGIEEALFSGLPERAAQLLALLDHRRPVLLRNVIKEKSDPPTMKEQVRKMQSGGQVGLDNESKDRALVGDVISTVALTGQIIEEYSAKRYGLDMEIELKDDDGKPTAKKLYLQLKSGDSHLRKRERDGVEVFQIHHEDHAKYWMDQAYPVFLVIADSKGEVRWMEIRDYLKRESDNGKKPVKQIVFVGERFDVMSVRRWREKELGRGT